MSTESGVLIVGLLLAFGCAGPSAGVPEREVCISVEAPCALKEE